MKRQEAPNSSCDTGHQERVDINCQEDESFSHTTASFPPMDPTFVDHEKEFEEVGSHITTDSGVRLVSCGKAVSEELTLINVRRDLQVLGLDSREDEDQQPRSESSEGEIETGEAPNSSCFDTGYQEGVDIHCQDERLSQPAASLPPMDQTFTDQKKEFEEINSHVTCDTHLLICGKTGSGKLSFTNALLRDVEVIDNYGNEEDGQETSSMSSEDKLIEKQEALDSSSWFDTGHQERVDIICYEVERLFLPASLPRELCNFKGRKKKKDEKLSQPTASLPPMDPNFKRKLEEVGTHTTCSSIVPLVICRKPGSEKSLLKTVLLRDLQVTDNNSGEEDDQETNRVSSEMASSICQRLLNKQWRSYADDLHQVPEAEGIYTIGNAAGVVLYVGHSKHMRTRLHQRKYGQQMIDFPPAFVVVRGSEAVVPDCNAPEEGSSTFFTPAYVQSSGAEALVPDRNVPEEGGNTYSTPAYVHSRCAEALAAYHKALEEGGSTYSTPAYVQSRGAEALVPDRNAPEEGGSTYSTPAYGQSRGAEALVPDRNAPEEGSNTYSTPAYVQSRGAEALVPDCNAPEEGGSTYSTPAYVQSRGAEALAAYRKALEEGGSYDKRVKILLVGEDRVGKTSIGKSLRDELFGKDECNTVGVQLISPVNDAGTEAWKNSAYFENATMFDEKIVQKVWRKKLTVEEEQSSDGEEYEFQATKGEHSRNEDERLSQPTASLPPMDPTFFGLKKRFVVFSGAVGPGNSSLVIRKVLRNMRNIEVIDDSSGGEDDHDTSSVSSEGEIETQEALNSSCCDTGFHEKEDIYSQEDEKLPQPTASLPPMYPTFLDRKKEELLTEVLSTRRSRGRSKIQTIFYAPRKTAKVERHPVGEDTNLSHIKFIDRKKELEEVATHRTLGSSVRLIVCGKPGLGKSRFRNALLGDVQFIEGSSSEEDDQETNSVSSVGEIETQEAPTSSCCHTGFHEEEDIYSHEDEKLSQKTRCLPPMYPTFIDRKKEELLTEVLSTRRRRGRSKIQTIFYAPRKTAKVERHPVRVLPPFSCHPFCLVEQGYKVVHLGNNALSRDPMTCCKTSFTDIPPELRIISEGCEDVIHIKTTSMNTVCPHHLRCLSRKDVQLRGRMKMNDAFNTFFEQLTHICNYHSGATLMNYLAPENLSSHSYEAMQIGGLREMFPQSSAQETRSTITGRWNDSVDVIPVRKLFLTLNRTPEMSPEQEAIKSSAKLQNELLLQEERFRHGVCLKDYIEYLFFGVDYWRMKIAENQSEQEQSQELMKLFVELWKSLVRALERLDSGTEVKREEIDHETVVKSFNLFLLWKWKNGS